MSLSTPTDREAHWDAVYRDKQTTDLSWFQEHPAISLELIMAAAPDRDARIVDVGGGDSLLVDHLLQRGYGRVTVLDISHSAIERAQARLGDDAGRVRWIVRDVLAEEASGVYDVWHDRALFHFLLEPAHRQQYVAAVRRTVVAEGAVLVATFAPDGPGRCSGLEVLRYDEPQLAAELGEEFEIRETRREEHYTPQGVAQRFAYVSLRRIAAVPKQYPS
jgi:ubiquinone/menaquinone biosynthesis C-methylase UbiE